MEAMAIVSGQLEKGTQDALFMHLDRGEDARHGAKVQPNLDRFILKAPMDHSL